MVHSKMMVADNALWQTDASAVERGLRRSSVGFDRYGKFG